MFIRWMGRPLPARSGMSDVARFAPHLCQAKCELMLLKMQYRPHDNPRLIELINRLITILFIILKHYALHPLALNHRSASFSFCSFSSFISLRILS